MATNMADFGNDPALFVKAAQDFISRATGCLENAVQLGGIEGLDPEDISNIESQLELIAGNLTVSRAYEIKHKLENLGFKDGTHFLLDPDVDGAFKVLDLGMLDTLCNLVELGIEEYSEPRLGTSYKPFENGKREKHTEETLRMQFLREGADYGKKND